MKKRSGFLFILATILFIPFILAQEFNPYTGGGYDSPFSMSIGNFSFQTLLYSDWFFGLIAFLVFFTIYLFILRKFFKEVAVILALLLATASAVGLLMSIGNIFANISPWFIVIIIAAVLFGLFRNLRNYGRHLSITLLIVAVLWFAVGKQYLCGMTWMPYRVCPVIDTICIIIIVIAILYGVWYIFWGRQYAAIQRPQQNQQGAGPEQYTLMIAIHGNGVTNPGQGNHNYNQNQRVTINANPGNNSQFDHWEMDGNNMGNHVPLNVTMNQDHHLLAIFTGAGGGIIGGGGGRNPPRIRLFATPNTINAGETSTIAWATVNAVRVDISGGVGRQGPKGRYPVRPNATTTYTATAYGAGGTAVAIVTVHVNATEEPPQQAREKRSVYDLQRRYMSYAFQLQQAGKNQWKIRRILKVLNIIEAQLHRAGGNIPSGYQTPDQYEVGLRKNRKIT